MSYLQGESRDASDAAAGGHVVRQGELTTLVQAVVAEHVLAVHAKEGRYAQLQATLTSPSWGVTTQLMQGSTYYAGTPPVSLTLNNTNDSTGTVIERIVNLSPTTESDGMLKLVLKAKGAYSVQAKWRLISTTGGTTYTRNPDRFIAAQLIIDSGPSATSEYGSEYMDGEFGGQPSYVMAIVDSVVVVSDQPKTINTNLYTNLIPDGGGVLTFACELSAYLIGTL